MSTTLQLVIVLAVMLVAVGYIVWRGLQLLRRRGEAGCGSGCGTCPANTADVGAVKKPLVGIGTGRLSAKR